MQYIKDIHNDEWILDMNLGVAEELDAFVREAYQVDLFDAVQMLGLLARPTNVVSFASCLCRQQREKRDLSPEDFGRRWKGEAAYKLQQALWAEYRDFFPDPRIADLISSTIKQLSVLSESEGRIVKRAMEQLTSVMTDAVREMESNIGGELSS